MGRWLRLSNPVWVGSLAVLLLAGRWIWVAGLGDYGWSYEIASRILRGEVYYRDFLLLYGPLSHYTLATLLATLGDHLFVVHVHLWLSYAAALAAGLVLLRELGAPAAAQAGGIAPAAVIACPAFGWGHAFNYQAIFLTGAAIVCALRARRSRVGVWSAWAGAVTALCIYDKQNVGLVLAVLLPLFLPRAGWTGYLSGLGGVFAAVFGYFAYHAGVGEAWRQLFVDAAGAKGGMLVTVARATPRLIFAPGIPYRRWWEAAATAVAYAGLIPVTVWISRRVCAPRPATEEGVSAGWAALGAVGAGIAVSAAPIHLNAEANWFTTPWVQLMELTYILFALCAVCVGRGLGTDWAAAMWMTLGAAAAQEASNPNFSYSAPLAVPMLVALLSRAGVRLAPGVIGGVVLALYLMAPRALSSNPTYRLPAGSPFAGLRAPAGYAETVSEWWSQLRPIVDRRRTLWLMPGGGPYLAYGGLPAYGAPCYMPDSFPVRLDQRLIRHWREHPPDVLVLSEDFRPSTKSHLLTAAQIHQQVLAGYTEVWRSRRNPRMGVWVRR